MEPMGSEQSQQQSPRKSDLASPAKTTERDVTSKQGVKSISSHASPTADGACMSSSPSTSSGTSPASGVGSSHHSPANSIGTSPIGGASRHSIANSLGTSPTGGASHSTQSTGGAGRNSATKHLDIPERHGKSKKSRSIAKLKLATQVGVDSSGAIRKDFPFENITSRNKLKELTHNTLFSTVPLKKRKVDEWVAKQTSSESLTTSGDVSFVFGKTHHNTYSYIGETEKSKDMSTTDLENSSLIVNVSSTAGDMMTISSTAGDVMTNPGDGNDESMVGDETQMTSVVDGSDHTYASHGDATRDYLGDGDNEASDEPNNPGDDAQENNVTNESTLGSGELFSATSVDTVPETPPEEQNRGATPETDVVGDDTLTDETMTKTSKGKKTKTHAALVVGGGDGEWHVTITVHSDVTGLISDILKKWRSYTKSLKNVSLKTSLVVSMTNLNPTASRSGTKAYKMTSSVTSRDSPKKIKIYVDEDLEVEAGLIQERIQEK